MRRQTMRTLAVPLFALALAFGALAIHGSADRSALASASGPSVYANGSVVFDDSFDDQQPGAPSVSEDRYHFSGPAGGTVENTIAASAPNAVGIAAAGDTGIYDEKDFELPDRAYGGGLSDLTLQFSLYLGENFVLPANDYMTIAQILMTGGAACGPIDLIMTGGGNGLHIDYSQANDSQQTLYSSVDTIPTGAWQTFDLQAVMGPSGSLTLVTNGNTAQPLHSCRRSRLFGVFHRRHRHGEGVRVLRSGDRGHDVLRRCSGDIRQHLRVGRGDAGHRFRSLPVLRHRGGREEGDRSGGLVGRECRRRRPRIRV